MEIIPEPKLPDPSKARPGLRGFTLIKLLAVISTIALLIAILLPALGAARMAARKAVSSTHLGGIHQDLVIHAGANNGYFVGLNDSDDHLYVTDRAQGLDARRKYYEGDNA
ncbi:MAG: hypothetical protein WD534_16120 [Phycisphaeraceae bacterium]